MGLSEDPIAIYHVVLIARITVVSTKIHRQEVANRNVVMDVRRGIQVLIAKRHVPLGIVRRTNVTLEVENACLDAKTLSGMILLVRNVLNSVLLLA